MSIPMLPGLGLGFLLIAGGADAGKAPAHKPEEVVAAILSNHVERAQMDPARLAEAARTNGIAAPGVVFAGGPMAGEAPLAPAWRIERVDDGLVVLGVRSLKGRAVVEDIRGEVKKVCADEPGLRGLVLDLRSLADFLHFQEGARLVSLFVPEGTAVFSLAEAGGGAEKFSTQEVPLAPLPPVAVLIGPGTGGVGEAVADALRTLNRAVLFGSATSGLAAEYGETRLSSGRYLRVPVRRVLGPGGKAVFPDRVGPDLGVKAPAAKAEGELLRDEWRDGVKEFVAEAAPAPRQNEAALVRGENPELEAAIRTRIGSAGTNQTGRAAQPKDGKQKPKAADTPPAKDGKKAPVIKDAALQRALDFLRGVDALGLNRAPSVHPEPKRPPGETNAAGKVEGKSP